MPRRQLVVAALLAGLLGPVTGAAQTLAPQTVPVVLELKIAPIVLPATSAAVVPAPALLPTAPDYTALLQSILTSTKLLLDVQAQQLALEKDTNAQVSLVHQTFSQQLADVGVFVGKYIAPAIIAYLAGKKLL